MERIGVRPGRRVPAETVASANLAAGHGVDQSRPLDTSRDGPRQVTLIAVGGPGSDRVFLGLPEVLWSLSAGTRGPWNQSDGTQGQEIPRGRSAARRLGCRSREQFRTVH
jgi:hypothetical protein